MKLLSIIVEESSNSTNMEERPTAERTSHFFTSSQALPHSSPFSILVEIEKKDCFSILRLHNGKK